MIKVLQITEPLVAGVLHSISKICCGLYKEFSFSILHGVRKETPIDYIKYFPKDIEFIRWNVKREVNIKRDWFALKELNSIIDQLKPNIIHAHSSKAGALARLLSYKKKIPIIYSPRGYSFLRLDMPLYKRLFYKFIEKKLSSSKYITAACGLGEYTEALKISKHSVLIPNMINISDFPEINIKNKKKNPFNLVMIGRISPQKNFPLFCEIAKMFSNSNFRFLWIGDGKIPKNFNIPNNVKITGWIPRSKVLEYLIESHVFLQTSLWEGLPIAMLEAMVMKLPVLAMPCIGNTELIVEGCNGYICDTKHKFVYYINKLYNNSEDLFKFGDFSKKIVEKKYNVKQNIYLWKSLYYYYNRYYYYG